MAQVVLRLPSSLKCWVALPMKKELQLLPNYPMGSYEVNLELLCVWRREHRGTHWWWFANKWLEEGYVEYWVESGEVGW